jgi:SAM-dependent methyltransferase
MLINVSRQEFAYLKTQRGDLDHLSGDYPRWLAAYREKLEETYVMIEPHLPARCDLLLDIGSGLGGIDVLLCKHYAEKLGKIPRVHLLDGDGSPQMQQHSLPFSNMSLAVNFLQRHGVREVSFSTPEKFQEVGIFDLVVSFAAWGFHIPVSDYLGYVLDHSHKDTVMIVDARRPKAVTGFREYFLVRTIQCGKKYDRLVMKRGE